jgi:type 2 lantibiotic biosynthesis protein LanM
MNNLSIHSTHSDSPILKEDLIRIYEQACSLQDRLENCFVPEEASKENDNLITLRLERWCKIAAEGNMENFEKRLAWDGISLDRVMPMLGSVKKANQCDLPGWIVTFSECMNAAISFSIDWTNEEVLHDEYHFLEPLELLPFQELFIPFVSVARQKLYDSISSRHSKLLSVTAKSRLERSLLKWIVHICVLSLELEFSTFRLSTLSTISRYLTRNDNLSRKTYIKFINNLFAGGLNTFFREYPVLARLVATSIDLWVESSQELFCRLDNDLLDIQRHFHGDMALGQVDDLKADLSDRHNNGRSVMALTFSSGLKLIYKPKNVSIEHKFSTFLGWLNDHDILLPFKPLRVIVRSDYGWVEFVETIPCKNISDARNYYQRHGMLICLAYVLGATDLHYGNIIACGEHPVLIDLETLMHPQMRQSQEATEDRFLSHAINTQLCHSVLRTGILPQWVLSPNGQFYDASGIGGVSQEEIYMNIPHWYYINTDKMVLGQKNLRIEPGANTPYLDGEPLNLNGYIEEIAKGFSYMYSYLMRFRHDLLSSSSPLVVFAQETLRFVYRHTRTYALISKSSLKPDVLRDGVDRSICLDILSRSMISATTVPPSWPLIRQERQALENMDIPSFIARADKDSLAISRDMIIENFFKEHSYKSVLHCIGSLSNDDLERQLSFIRGSLYTRTIDDIHLFEKNQKACLDLDSILSTTSEELVDYAFSLGLELQKRGIYSDDNCVNWLSPQYNAEAQRYILQPLGDNLFDGRCGVALFFASLAKVSLDNDFRDFAICLTRSICNDFIHNASTLSSERICIGGALGHASIVYALVRIGEFLQMPDLFGVAERQALKITPCLISADKRFDIMSGSAGAILGLLTLYDVTLDNKILSLAIACGHHLLTNRVPSGSGYRAWETVGGNLLTGFSHGAAGIAYALLRLYKASGESEFLEAAQESIDYEHSVFFPHLGNWPDLRPGNHSARPSCACSWCNGAPGIGLARVAGLAILDSPEIRQDIHTAIETTMKYGLQDRDHLCCGNLGRLDFLFTSAQKLSLPQLQETAVSQAAQILSKSKRRGYFNHGFPLLYHPGLFIGAAGIGYQLLRLARPNQLPSILIWE